MFRRLVAGLLVFAALPAHGQFSQLLPKTEATVTQEESLPQTRERLQGWLKEAREEFAKLDDPAAESKLPEGVGTTEYSDRRRDVQQTIITVERQLKSLTTVAEAAESAKKAAAALESWKGFIESPPYSVLWVDDLRSQRDVASERHATSASTLKLFEDRLNESAEEAKGADEAYRLASGVSARNPAAADVTWRMEAARLRCRSISARIGLFTILAAQQRELLSEAGAKLAFVAKQLSQIESHAFLSEDDLTQVRKSAAIRQATLAKEGEEIRKRYNAALSNRRKLESQSTAEKPDPLLSTKIEAASTRVDSLQFTLDTLNALDQIESQIPDAYLNRRVLMTVNEVNSREGALKSLRAMREHLRAWGVYANNEISVAGAELRSQESRATSMVPDDPKLPLTNDLCGDLRDKLDVSQRLARTVDLQQRQMDAWLGDFEQILAQRSFGQRFSDGYDMIRLNAKKLWNLGIWDYEAERINANGQKIMKQETLPLGQLVWAILLFVLGYLAAAKFTRRMQAILVSKGRIGDAQSSTLRRWLMALLAFLLGIVTLKILNIPLTVFAFLGGALVIGIGFGTQTMIKNFISGIIVLLEGNIRVGDILNVDGIIGTVSEINTRSSILRSGDGVETLIPNSVFLESKITNWTHSSRKIRRAVKVGVEHGSPVHKVADILVECADRHGLILKEPAPVALFEDFGQNALLFELGYWVELNDKTSTALVASDLRFMIEKRFGEEGITIPAPNRDTRLITDSPLQVEWAPKG
jgi:potassium-dependent mechanosensitive channel